MKNMLSGLKNVARRFVGTFCLAFAALLAFALLTGSAFAQTDVSAAITSVSGYWTAAEVIALGIVLFVVGRKVLRKI